MIIRGRVPLWLTTTVLAVSGMAAAFQFTMTLPLLPEMPDLLGVTANDASWIVTVTLLASAVATPVLSRMADMYGKRRMIIVALLAMTAGSFIIAIGGTFPTMIIGRTLQGFAQSVIPIGISLLRDLLPRERVGAAVALMSATLGIGSAMGLPLSGVFYETLGWQSVLWFGGITGAIFVVGILLVVDESPVRAPGKFDALGAVLLSVILTAVLLVVSKAGRWEIPVIVSLAGVAVVGLVAWVPLQLRTNNPMVDLRTTARRPVLLTNVSTLFSTAATFANMLLTVQQVQAPAETGYGFGLTVIGAGLVMLPAGLVMVILSPFAGGRLNRWGAQRVLVWGNVTIAGAFVFRVFVYDSVPVVIVGAAIASVGSALAFAALPTLLMAAVPLTETASANGINSLVRSIAMSGSSALIALLLTTSVAVTINDHDFLSTEALHLCFWIAATFGLVAAAIAWFIPVDTRVAPASAGGTHPEVLLRGRVILGDDVQPRNPAIVTFMNLDGTPVDWSRADLDGSYSAVLPAPGRYLAVANAAGWAPQTHVVEVNGTEVEWDATISEQLMLSGRVTKAGETVAGAVVAIHRVDGGYSGSVRTVDGGRYAAPLPPSGPYMITAIAPDAEWAHSRKLIVGVQLTVLDIEVLDS